MLQRGDAMRVIAIVNQKGGCGKTTTVVNLAGALAADGASVLVVDMDPQAHATLALGRVGAPGKDIHVLQRVAGRRRGKDANVERSAAIALGTLGRRGTPEDRVEIARGLVPPVDEVLAVAEMVRADSTTASMAFWRLPSVEFLMPTGNDNPLTSSPFSLSKTARIASVPVSASTPA